MAKRSTFLMTVRARQLRRFSEEFKKQKVLEIQSKSTTISEVCKAYEVADTNVRKWIAKYSSNYQKGIVTIVESESDTKKLIEAKKRIAELERLIGQKQIQLEFKDKVIELAEEYYQIDIKKKFESKPSYGSGNKEKDYHVV